MLRKGSRIGLILFILILVASFFAFTGCKKKIEGITVASWWLTYNVDTYEPRDEGEAKTLDYRKKLIKDQGFNFQSVEIADYDNFFPLVVSNIMSGSRAYQIYELSSSMAMTLYKQGLLYPIGDSKAVNFKVREAVAGVVPVYDGLVEDFMTFNGKQYGWMYGHPNDGWGQTMLYFNVKHLTDAGLSPDYLYNLQRDNNWTWDTFLDLCKKLTRDTNNDGITDIYALPCDDAREFIMGLVFGNGADFVTIDSQGKASNATNSPAFLEALAFYNQLINEGLVQTTPEYDWGWNWSAFVDERVAMTFDPEWRKGEMQANFDAGYVLPPRGPRSSQLRLGAGGSVYAIPKYYTAEEVDTFLKAFEKWEAPVDTDWLGGHYWASRNLRDVTETVVMSRDPRYLTLKNQELIPGYPFDNFINEFRNGLGSVSPSTHVEKWTPQLQSAIDEYNR